MFGLLAIAIIALYIVLYRQRTVTVADSASVKFGDKLDKLWQVAQEALKDQKYLRAEKALLTILRVDERNATAYNRLGILYAKQQAYKDAIECFEIAQSLEPSASSLHNVGLIYLETNNLDKAALAFEQAMKMEPNMPARHIAYAKVLQKMDKNDKAIASLEKAVELERSVQSLRILAEAYDIAGKTDKAAALKQEIETMLAAAMPAGKAVRQTAATQAATRPAKQARRKVVM